MSEEQDITSADQEEDRAFTWVGKIIIAIVCIAILVVASLLGKLLVATGPKAEKKEAETVLPVVEVQKVFFANVAQAITAEGETRARRETQMTAEVAGKVVFVSPRFEVGEIFETEEVLLRLEDADYQAALAQARASVEDARLAVAMEEAQAKQAQREWDKLGKGGEPSDLVLRKPQLASARARLTAAAAVVQKSERDMERTVIRAPYRCRIRQKGIQVGANAIPGSPIAAVMSAESVEVVLPIPMEDLAWIEKKEGQFIGQVVAQAEWEGEMKSWKGKIIRSEGIVDRASRNMRMVVSFDGEKPPVGLFITATIEGRDLNQVIRLPAAVLTDDGFAWIVDSKSRLQKRKVTIEREAEGQVYLSKGGGLEEGELVCMKVPSTVVVGMKVEVKSDKEEGTPKETPETPKED